VKLFLIYARKKLNAWINFHLFGVIVKVILCDNVGAFETSENRKSNKQLLPGKVCLCFGRDKIFRNEKYYLKNKVISNVLKPNKVCV